MSATTVQALITTGDWNAETRKHPAGKWMEQYTDMYDQRRQKAEADDWLDMPNYQYCKSDGSIYKGDAAVDQLVQDYSFFTRYHHEPYYVVATETPDGKSYGIIGNAWLFFDLPGNASGPGVTDLRGDKWQMKLPGGFVFKYIKDSSAKYDGLKLASTSITTDTGPVVMELLKRGVMKPQDLGL